MRGLLVKDWKICKRVLLPMLALYLAFDAVAGIIGTEQSMLRDYSPVMAAVIAASVVGDEIRSGYAFSMTLPFDAKTFVLEKNLFFLLAQAAAWALSKVVMAVILMVSGRPAPETGEFFFSGLWMVLLVLIFLGWLFAASLRFDAERFRMVLLGVVFGRKKHPYARSSPAGGYSGGQGEHPGKSRTECSRIRQSLGLR